MRVILGGERYLKPREIADLGLITNSMGHKNPYSNYQYILKLIKRGDLKAKNYSTGKIRKYWLVSEREIDRYNKRFADK